MPPAVFDDAGMNNSIEKQSTEQTWRRVKKNKRDLHLFGVVVKRSSLPLTCYCDEFAGQFLVANVSRSVGSPVIDRSTLSHETFKSYKDLVAGRTNPRGHPERDDAKENPPCLEDLRVSLYKYKRINLNVFFEEDYKYEVAPYARKAVSSTMALQFELGPPHTPELLLKFALLDTNNRMPPRRREGTHGFITLLKSPSDGKAEGRWPLHGFLFLRQAMEYGEEQRTSRMMESSRLQF